MTGDIQLPGKPTGAQGAIGKESDIRGFVADGAALGLSSMFTAVVGLVGWLVAARLLTPAEVGRANAFVSGFLLIAGFAELGLSQAMLRWLPVAGSHAKGIVARAYAASVIGSLLIGLPYAFLTGVDLPGIDATLAKGLFVLSAIAWMLFHLQDYALTGTGAARWVPLENITFGVVRVVLLVVFATQLGSLGIVLSWTVSSVIWVSVVTLILLAVARRSPPRPGVMPTRRDALTMAGSTYATTLGQTLLAYAVPIIVIARYGPVDGAVFSIVWLGLNALDYIAVGFGSALVVRLRGGSMTLLRNAVTRIVPVYAVALVVAALLAGLLLQLFGQRYADLGTNLLRLAILGAMFRVVFVLIASIHLAQGRSPRMAALHWTSALVMVGVVSLAPVSHGLAFLGAGYAVVQVLLLVVAYVDLARVSRTEVPA